MSLGWYAYDSFDAAQWRDLEQMDRGDMNWLIPGKLLAFASPYHMTTVQGVRVCTPAEIAPVFHSLRITTIVRLNNKTYDETPFLECGFGFVEMFFPDGTCPPDEIVADFLGLVSGDAVVALHCKAGLGRTYSCFLTTEEHSPPAS
jgi:cell division cycle 14